MLSTQCLTNLAVLRFEIVSDWKLSFIKLTFLVRLTRLLRLISLAHRATELLFSLAQEQNLFALGNLIFFFLSCVNIVPRFNDSIDPVT